MTLRAQSDFMDAVGEKDDPSTELPAATFAAYLGDTITGDVNSPSRNAIPATAQTALVFGAGASVQEGVLTTNGTSTGYIRSEWINGSDINQNMDWPTTTIDAGYGSSDSSLVVQSISGEDDLNYYATLTTSTDPVDTRALILTAYDKSTPAGVAVRLPNGLGLKGVHGWAWRITPSLKRVSITHVETNQTTTVNLPTFSWSGRVCIAQGHAFRGYQGVNPNRTIRGAEKFRVSQSLGYVGVAQHATTQETRDAIAIITSDYVHPKVALSPTSLTLKAGATPATFTATVENSTKSLVWTLVGPGSIPANSTGSTVVYTPPTSLTANSSARLEVTLIDGRAFDGTTINLQPADVVTGPDARVALAPTSLSTIVNSPPTTFTATVTNSSAGVVFSLSPATGLGTLVQNGLTAVYTPPSTPGSTGQVTVKATLAGSSTVFDGTAVNVGDTGGSGGGTSGGTPGTARPDIYRMDTSFRSSNLPERERGFYESGFANVKRLLNTEPGRTDGSRFLHNDTTANAHARTNSTQYSQAVPMFWETGDPAFVDWVFDKLELIRKGMTTTNVGDNIPYHADGKSSQRRAIEQEAYYGTAKTITNDDGTTFSTSWKAWPKLIYIHHNRSLIKSNGDEDEDNASSGTDLHTHDGLPRLGAILELCLIGDRNKDRPRAAGKMDATELMNWWYQWFFKDFAFRRYRADNSAHVPGGFRQGKTATIEGYGKYIDWKKDIAHDFVQQNQVDANMWEWARLREGATSTRAKFWEEVFRTRAKLIFDSMAFWSNAPNGFDTVGCGHKLSAVLYYGNRTSTITKKVFTKTQAYSTGGWLMRYCDDMFPSLACMTYKRMPYYSDEHLAKSAANNFTQFGIISDTKIAAGMVGVLNKFYNGVEHAYPDYWPKGTDGKPVKLSSPSDYLYTYGNAHNPSGEADNLAGTNQRFKEVQGYEILGFDPTPNLANFKRAIEIANLNIDGSCKYTPAKGKTQTTGNNVFVKMQIISFLLARKTGKDLTTI